MAVDAVEVSTVVYLPPEEVYAFLIDFPRYADYSKYLTEVTRHGDGTPGTEYDLHFAWWKLTYTARSRVISTDRPARVDWEIAEDIDARGHWSIEAVPEEAPKGRETASRVRLRIEFDASSADPTGLDLPRLVSLSWVIGKVKPLIEREAERIVSRIVADLEGERRPVELSVHARPDTV
jgi:ribosome-associated toxin RatA of RatAB toxin-antitoxin module